MDQATVLKKIKEKEEEDKQMPAEMTSSSLHHLTDDAVLVLFTHLTLHQAFKLGSTCRRLYGLYRKALTDRRSLVPSEGSSFHLVGAQRPSSSFPPVTEADRFSLPSDLSTTRRLFAQLPNLVCLEIDDTPYYRPVFLRLVNCLNTSLTKLQCLKLYFQEVDGHFSKMKRAGELATSLPVNGREQQLQLQLPLLKHIELGFFDPVVPYDALVKTVFKSSTFHAVFPQLSSFYMSVYCDCGNFLPEALQFIYRHLHLNSQLMAAAAESGGSKVLNIALSIFLGSQEVFWKQVKEGTLPHEVAGGLAFVTELELNNLFSKRNHPVLFVQLLTLMPNVRKVHFASFGFERSEAQWEFPYSHFLRGLATLRHLEEIELDLSWTIKEEARFRKSELPVLPSVRSLFLQYRSTYHADPVELLQLAHCFPGLKAISVLFCEEECEYCEAHRNSCPVALQRCGLNLARGLLRLGDTGAGVGITAWESAVKVEQVVVSGEKVRFTSLANLLAGQYSER